MSAFAVGSPQLAPDLGHRAAPASGPVRRRRWLLLLGADVLGATVAGWTLLPGDLVPGPTLVVAFVLVWIVLLGVARSYDSRPVPTRSDLARFALAGVHLVAVGGVLNGLTGLTLPSDDLVAASAAVVVGSGGMRYASSLRAPRATRVVLVGHRRPVSRLVDELQSSDQIVVVGVCVAGPKGRSGFVLPTASGFTSVAALARTHRADCVVALPCRHLDASSLRRLGWLLERDHVDLLIGPGLHDVDSGRAVLRRTGDLSLLYVRHADLTGPRRLLKQLCERAVSAAALMVLSPLLLVLAVLVRLESPGPAFFHQPRVGREGVEFSIHKLRTMHVDAESRREALHASNDSDGALFKMRQDPRVTRLGRWLRRTSLDELPQLVNVVRGEMALVGPRPPLPGEVTTYDEDAMRRLAVRPGITGLWQVSGRSDLPWAATVRLDSRYVDNWSLRLDIWILLRTVPAVLRSRGAY